MDEPLTVLIVDDNEDDRQLYRRYLQKDDDASYLIVEADSGDRILEWIKETSPDCVLLDYSLPGRDGVEVLRQIRSAYPFVPVVMLTGQGNESLAVSAMREGAQNYITKSVITPLAIRRTISMAIDHCAMARRMDEQRTSLEIFSRALAHDLKEPVRTIRSYIDLMMSPETSADESRRFFEYVRTSAERMERLIDTVHFYTRLESGAAEVSVELCDAGEIMMAARDNIAELVRTRGAVVTNDPLPLVRANWMQLLQVIQNLLCNAIHHCPEKPVVHVAAIREEDHWVFRVSDNGEGIPEANREKIFAPFARLGSQSGQRLGLGLAICKKIVESHGGKIWYEPNSSAGATFSFTLPVGAAPTGDVSNDSGAPSEGAETPHREPMANVLLVDDNDADIELTQIILLAKSRLRCNILIARDGQEALQLIAEQLDASNRIDLVLLDINMPRMDGLEMLEKMRGDQRYENIPVVMCSTSFYDRDVAKAKALGAVDYITKPMEFGKFRNALDKLTTVQIRWMDQGYVLTRAA